MYCLALAISIIVCFPHAGPNQHHADWDLADMQQKRGQNEKGGVGGSLALAELAYMNLAESSERLQSIPSETGVDKACQGPDRVSRLRIARVPC